MSDDIKYLVMETTILYKEIKSILIKRGFIINGENKKALEAELTTQNCPWLFKITMTDNFMSYYIDVDGEIAPICARYEIKTINEFTYLLDMSTRSPFYKYNHE